MYKSVLPGVDLSVSVTDQGGFSDVLIVHDATAAANPKIKQLTLAASTDGLALSSTPSNGMNATTADGTVAYTTPRPLMWDSTTIPAALSEAASTTTTTTAGDNTAVSSTDGPGAGAIVDAVPMTTTSSGLTLTPDASVLTDPGTTYPVYIDPYTNPVDSTTGHYDEIYSSSACSGSPQYDKAQTNGQGVGYQRWGGVCGTGLERSYYAMNTSNLHSSFVVSKAIVSVSTTYAASWDCSQGQPITLHTTDPIDSGTDWDNRPATHDIAYPPVTTHVASGANSGSSCSNDTADFTVTDQAKTIAHNDGNGPNATNTWTVGLYGNESISSSNDDYLRMSSSLKLTTTFDIPPDVPTNLRTVPKPSAADGDCVTSGVGWIGATTYSAAGSNIQLHSTVNTNIKGELADAIYHVWDRSNLDSAGNATSMSDPDSGNTIDGGDADTQIGFTLKDGHEYGWDVYAKDNSSAHLTSGTSDHCWFNTDFTAPGTPAVATNPTFPPVGSGPATGYAGSGVTADFSVSAADGTPAATCNPGPCLSSGIDHFLWQLDSQPTSTTRTTAQVTSTADDGTASATVTIPVTSWGVHNLYVAAVDKAGNISQDPASYTFAAPWNPDTKITPGDITGDGSPDLLATTNTGDLDLIPGNTDPAQAAASAQSGPISTPHAITGPVIVSTAAGSPDKTTWNDYLIAHRGNMRGGTADDLFAYNRRTKQFYIVKNDLDPEAGAVYSAYPGYLGQRAPDPVVRDDCESTSTVPADRCADAGYDNTAPWNITQLVTPGNVYGNAQNFPAVITVENNKLWIYQADGTTHLKHSLLLGDGDWSGLTLIAPGTVGGTFTTDANGNGTVTKGTPTLWARDNASGTIYTFPINVDDHLLPQLLHAPVRTALTSAVTASSGGSLCLDDDHAVIRIYTCNKSAAQTWAPLSDGSLRVMGKCLDVTDGGTTDGTLLQLYTCNGSGSQKWTTGTAGSLVNPQSGKCLDDPGASTTNGTQVRIYTCNGSAAQNWTSSTPVNWNANPATALPMVLPASGYPGVASPGDINSSTSGPDGNPDLYATDTAGQLTEYIGTTPTGTTANFTTPVSLGTVTNTATHWWNLNDGTGTTATDPTGNLPATLTGAATWATGTGRGTGTALNLSGTTGYAATSGPAVDTSGSFTVSAWVKLSSLTGNSTFVSQSDDPAVGAANGFQLYYSSGAQVWAFGRHNDDSTSTAFTSVYGAKAATGTWTHLVGIYDADTNQLLLYVNGSLSVTKTFAGTTWNAGGPLQLGRRLFQGSYGEYANGQISDVHIYNTALPPADAAAPGDNPRLTQLD